MLLLRFHSPPLPFEQRKIMAEELTVTLRDLTGVADGQIIIQFMPYALDNLAVDGKLRHDTEDPLYLIELTGVHTNPAFMGVLDQAIRHQCAELLGVSPHESERIQIHYPTVLSVNMPSQVQRPIPSPHPKFTNLSKP